MNAVHYSIYPYIIIGAAVCFALRLAPFVIFKNEESVPHIVKYIGTCLPPAIITGIVVYCLIDLTPLHFPYGVKEFPALAIVIALHLWKRNTFLSVFGGTAFYMFFVQML